MEQTLDVCAALPAELRLSESDQVDNIKVCLNTKLSGLSILSLGVFK